MTRPQADKLVGLLFVAALHAAALWALWSYRLMPAPAETATLFVNFLAPSVPEKPIPPKPRAIEKPQPRQLVAETPVVAPSDFVAPPPPPAPAPAPVIEASPLPAEPIKLGAELSVTCPERIAPPYPAASRRLNESGLVVLRVELDEAGHIAATSVQQSSGHMRLDQAALNAVRGWRCNPATRNGRPARAVALQPFNFVLQGN